MKITGTVQIESEVEEPKYGDQLTTGLWRTLVGQNYVYALIRGELRILISGEIYPFPEFNWQSHLFTKVTRPATLTVRIEP